MSPDPSLQNLNILATTTTNSSGWIHSNQDILLTGQTLNNIGHTHSEKIIESGNYADGTYWAGSGGEGAIYDIRVLNLPTTEKSIITDPGDTFITAGGNITGDFTGQIDNVSIFGGADPKTITGGNMDLARTSASLNAPQNAQTTAGSDAQNAQSANTTGPTDVTTTGHSQTQAANTANLTGPNGGTVNTTAQGAENTDVDAPSSLTTQNTAQGAQDADLNDPGENNLQNNQPFRATTADLHVAQAPTPAPAINVHATAPDIGLPSPEDLNAVFELPTSNGALFVQSKDPQANFILESNPVMNDLGALFSSDYFTQRANLSLDQEFIRLGDKDWETRQVRDQIMAVTHKRFLNDQITSDSDQYKTLMDNALAQHKELDLSYGIALSQEQIRALTQDMVWMVETKLNDGRTAVRPVVYLAEASRAQIDSSGASIIARGDLNLTSGGDFANSGTLKGTNVALTSETGSFTNAYGKVQATDTLSISAQEDIINTGGLILGKDVTLSATDGDFIQTTETWRQSETTVDHYQGVWGNTKAIAFNDIAGPRANVSALGGNLTINTGGDITDSGAGTFGADGNLTLDADGTISLASLTTRTRDYGLGEYKIDGVERSTELTSTLWSGGDMTLNSGAQSLLFGTKATAGGDLSINSTTDTFLSAVQNNTLTDRGDWGFGMRWSTEIDNDLAALKAGGNIAINSGLDTLINGTTITSGEDLTINSLASTTVNSVQDSFEQNIKSKKYTLIVDKKDTVRSKLVAEGDINVQSILGDVTLKAAEVNAGGAVKLASLSGDVNMTSNKDVDFYHEVKTKTGGMWTTFSDRGSLDEKVQHTTIDAGDGLTIEVGTNGQVNVDYKDFGNLDKSVERLSQEPGLEWMADVKNGVTPAQWNAIKEAHKSWDYSSQSLSPAAGMIIAIAATIATMGAGSVLAAGTAASSQSLGTMAAVKMGFAANSVMGTAVAAGINALTVSATVSMVSNKGDIGAVLKEMGSKESLRNLAATMISAGILQGTGILSTTTDTVSRIQNALVQAGINTAVQSTIGGKNLGDTLKMQLLMAAGQVMAQEIGSAAKNAMKSGVHSEEFIKVTKLVAHAAVGCGIGAASGGDCGSGAAGAVIGELTAEAYLQTKLTTGISAQDITLLKEQGLNLARLTTALAMAATGGDIHSADLTAGNAAANNALETIWDALSILYDTGKIGYGYFVNDNGIIEEGFVDLGVDSAALLIPFVPAGITKLGRGLSDPVAGLLKGAKTGSGTKGKTAQFEKIGDYNDAVKDFHSLKPTNVTNVNISSGGTGLKGTLPDGRTVIVRPTSKGAKTRPTLEIQGGINGGKGLTKVRYD